MATYLELQTEVLANLIDTPTAVQTYVPTYVRRAVKALQVRHNFKVMSSATQLVTTLSTRTLSSIPSNWKEARGRPYLVPFLDAPNRKLVWASNGVNVIPRFGPQTEGRPQVLIDANAGDDGSGIIAVYPLPDGNSDYSDGEYRIQVPYWRFLPELSANGDTNWFTVNADEWITFTATADGFRANEDETRMTFYKQLAAEKWQEVVNRDKRAWVAGQETLAIHTGGTEDDELAL